ncbi:MAG: hypothetical protein H0X62_01110 [Bacteroidetes bacterium]|nr:hypothetical protein [Bacteroidota bacterium]
MKKVNGTLAHRHIGTLNLAHRHIGTMNLAHRKIGTLIHWQIGTLLFLLWLFCLPARLFDVDYSTVVEDRDGKLLNAIVADDGQWRFAASEAIPEK